MGDLLTALAEYPVLIVVVWLGNRLFDSVDKLAASMDALAQRFEDRMDRMEREWRS